MITILDQNILDLIDFKGESQKIERYNHEHQRLQDIFSKFQEISDYPSQNEYHTAKQKTQTYHNLTKTIQQTKKNIEPNLSYEGSSSISELIKKCEDFDKAYQATYLDYLNIESEFQSIKKNHECFLKKFAFHVAHLKFLQEILATEKKIHSTKKLFSEFKQSILDRKKIIPFFLLTF